MSLFIIVQAIHNRCCQQSFLQQLKLEQLSLKVEANTRIPLHGFMWNNSRFLFLLCINNHRNKLLELNRKLKFKESLIVVCLVSIWEFNCARYS